MAAVAQVTTYQELQDHIADTLIRTDLATPITTFIQMAESVFKRDRRARKLSDRGTFSVSADGSTLPSDFHSMESWYHDGPTFYGPIEIVNADMIGQLKGREFGGQTGAPAHAAIIDGTARYAPEPNDTFLTKMVYWRKVDPLTTNNSTNWLLDDHPDIYIYGSLVHTAPYLKDDPRLQVWSALLEKGLEELDRATEDEMFSGSMKRHFRPIGG
ncbi:MAG: hypothetical protein V3S55_14910 [Nitrospiraceae bacterium]